MSSMDEGVLSTLFILLIVSVFLGTACGQCPTRTEQSRNTCRLCKEMDFADAHQDEETDSGSWIELGGSRVYLSLPKEEITPPLPGIVALHTSYGLTRNIRLWSDRLAEQGYAVVAVDLYLARLLKQGKKVVSPSSQIPKRTSI